MTKLMSDQKPMDVLDAIKTGEWALELDTEVGECYVVTDPIDNDNKRTHEIRDGFSFQSPRCTNKKIDGLTTLKLIMDHEYRLIER